MNVSTLFSKLLIVITLLTIQTVTLADIITTAEVIKTNCTKAKSKHPKTRRQFECNEGEEVTGALGVTPFNPHRSGTTNIYYVNLFYRTIWLHCNAPYPRWDLVSSSTKHTTWRCDTKGPPMPRPALN